MTEIGKESSTIMCSKCGIYLTMGSVTLSYLEASFPAELYSCAKCGLVYIPEDLALGKMANIEKTLEDK